MKLNLILPILLGITTLVRSYFDRSVCPAQVRTHRYLHLYADNCVLFVNDEQTWESARKYCQNLNGDLATIKDRNKQQFIQDALRSDNWDKHTVWIGANDKDQEGDWRWVDGSKVSYEHFADGQGYYHSGGFLLAGGSLENCALLRLDRDGHWFDYPCEPIRFGKGYHSFACEFHSHRISTTLAPKIASTTQVPSTSPTYQTTKGDTILTKIARPGDNVTFSCPIKIQNTGVIEWYGPPNASILYSSGSAVNPRLSSISITGDHSLGEYNLRITSVTKFDNGIYRCSFKHGGLNLFQTFSLRV